MKKRILLVEDDEVIARVLGDNLKSEGFEIECVGNGDAAVVRARQECPDLVVLDLMLPGRSGFDVCSALRERGRTPIIVLSARGQNVDKVRALNLGADDYITKPFDLEELLARVRAVLRRTRPTVERLMLGPVKIDFHSRRATVGNRELRLSHREFEVLQYLAERQKKVVHRSELLREVWGYVDEPNTRAVDYAIIRLRRKIERDFHHPRFIHTVRGDGYMLTVPHD